MTRSRCWATAPTASARSLPASRRNREIGRSRRVITFGAFRRYSRHGAERQDYPPDWDLAKQD